MAAVSVAAASAMSTIAVSLSAGDYGITFIAESGHLKRDRLRIIFFSEAGWLDETHQGSTLYSQSIWPFLFVNLLLRS